MSSVVPQEHYKDFLNEVIIAVKNSQYKAYQAVNRQLVELYWAIGKQLHDKIEVAKWGEGIVEQLSLDLQMEFPDAKGFSEQNLWRTKQMYETYYQQAILSTLLRELPWSHNVLILHQTNSMAEKEFYLKTCASEHWSYRELKKQMDNRIAQKWAASDNGNKLIPHSTEKDPSAHFRDEYNLGFLGLKEPFAEKDLRKAIVHNLRDFFLEFGKHLTFVGEEYPINVSGRDFRVDLLFYHRVLQCLVAVELKTGPFEPEYVGKMQFYLAALDKKLKLDHEKPSVGLILCKTKGDEIIELAMAKSSSATKVATYEIIDQKLLERKMHSLPMPKEIEEHRG